MKRENQTMNLANIDLVKVPGLDRGASHSYLNFEYRGAYVCTPGKTELKKLRSWCDEVIASMERAERRARAARRRLT